MSGADLLRVLEQGLSLERGIMQVSGITVNYDLKRVIGSRVLTVLVNGKALKNDARYTVSTGSFIVNGGDMYSQFENSEVVKVGRDFSEALTDYFRARDEVSMPRKGRLIPGS